MEVSNITLEEIAEIARILRGLSIDQVETANSGHPGLPLGCADIVATLFCKYLRFNPKDPSWPLRDRFVLSAGHGSALLYAVLSLFGYPGYDIKKLSQFRRLESNLPGHPEAFLGNGVEATTGPLGQGVANSVGMALASKMMESRDKNFSGFKVFCLASDGDLMEGVSYEASSLAGFLELDNLILMYDDNDISLAGPTDVCFTENVKARFEAQNWKVFSADGHNLNEIDSVFKQALMDTSGLPKLIIFKTTIGYGSPKANSFEVHGSPLGESAYKETKKFFNLPDEKFWVSDYARDIVKKVNIKNESYYTSYESSISFELDHAKIWSEMLEHVSDSIVDATRNSGAKFLNFLAEKDERIIGGSADLEPSTKAYLKKFKDINPKDYSGRNIRFGVREHGMAGIANGIAYTGFFRPFVSTFLCFLDYLKPSLRLSALSELPVVYILTHDSIFLGEDGPTHQPIEHLNHLRSIPNIFIFRPANELECAFSYWWSFTQAKNPSVIILSRQNIDQTVWVKPSLQELKIGAYVAKPSREKPVLSILASGSEVPVVIKAVKNLNLENIEVVSVPCFELLYNNIQAAQNIIRADRVLVVEAASTSSKDLILSTLGKRVYHKVLTSFGSSDKDSTLAKLYKYSENDLQELITDILNSC